MRRLGVLCCGVIFALAACSGSGSDSSTVPAEPGDLPQLMSDTGFACGGAADTQADDYYGGVIGIPHRNLDCSKGGDTGSAVRFFIWDEEQARDAYLSNAADQFCGSNQRPTFVIGDGWAATVTTRNTAGGATIIDEDGMAEIADLAGGEVKAPFC